MSEYFLIFAALIIGILFCMLLYKWLFRPRKSKAVRRSAKRMKKTASHIGLLESQRALNQKLAIANLFCHVPLVKLTEDDKEELRTLILAVDKRSKDGRLLLPEEIYIRELAIAGTAFLAIVLTMLITPLTVFGILAIPMLMRIPVKMLEAERAKCATALADEFLAFYKLYYVQFIQPDNTTTLSHVINSYLPSASVEVKKILKVVDGDLAKGEEFALKRFDQRFPDSPKVHKFCSVARARLKGDKSSYEALKSFLDVLIEEHDVFFDREKLKREHRLSNLVTSFLMISMVTICIVVFGMMFASN